MATSMIKTLLKYESVTKTTSATGVAKLEVSNDCIVVAVTASPYLIIPFKDSGIWFGKVLAYSNMSAVANTSVTMVVAFLN